MANNPAFVQTYRLAVTHLLARFDELRNLNAQYVALDLGTELVDHTEGNPGDFDGNADITKAEFIAGIASVDAINDLFVQGHNTNLYKLIKQ
jgi:hypothetical protein